MKASNASAANPSHRRWRFVARAAIHDASEDFFIVPSPYFVIVKIHQNKTNWDSSVSKD